jgi:hypothetical protein
MSHEERKTTEHMWNRCSEMRERERKELGEILNEDGREIRWMKEIWIGIECPELTSCDFCFFHKLKYTIKSPASC